MGVLVKVERKSRLVVSVKKTVVYFTCTFLDVHFSSEASVKYHLVETNGLQ